MVTVCGHAYPWDVVGDPSFAGRVADLGIEAVTLAAAYHSARAATPLHPRHQLVDASYAALYRPVREPVWQAHRLRPQPPQWMDVPDPFGQAAETLRAAGLRVTAWIVLTHNTRLGTAHPELAVQNCFGQRYPYALCPRNEPVRAYAATLAAEALHDVAVDGVSLEACGQLGLTHLSHHEKTDDAWTAEAARLLSICCCAACQDGWQERGLDLVAVLAALREAVAGEASGTPRPLTDDMAAALLAVRHQAADALRAQVLEAVRRQAPDAPVTLHAHPDPWATGASPGLTATAAKEADALLVPAWPTTPATADLVARAAAAGPPVDAYVTLLPPADPAELPAHIRRLVAAGASRLSLYHLGLAPRWRQRLFSDILDEVSPKRGADMSERSQRMADQGMNPYTGEPAGPPVPHTSAEDLDRICQAAARAAADLAALPLDRRAELLRAAAAGLEKNRDEIVALADAETGLGATRLGGELTRTRVQLELFADVVLEGSFLEATIDLPDPGALPAPRPDLRRMLLPLGPVAVFSASNFPLAFSVTGGDTASALAAGCPVVVKAHSGHPGLSVLCGRIVGAALAEAGAPDGTFAVVHGTDVGRALVQRPAITAAGFTGSVTGGRALFDLASARPDPIPFYGELGSLNPAVITPAAVAARGADLVREFVGSFTLGAGQFCTKPGLLFLPKGHGLDDALRAAVGAASVGPLLNKRIHSGYGDTAAALAAVPGVRAVVAATEVEAAGYRVAPVLLAVSATDLVERADTLLEECFGPAALIIEYGSAGELGAALDALPASLTATLHADAAAEDELARQLLARFTGRAGRVIWGGWPTGVAVTWAMHHGGPWPATTAPLHTSVGATSIRRWLRPIAYQGVPDQFLPDALRNANPLGIPRRINGVLSPDGVVH